VIKNQSLIVCSAMKMDNDLISPCNGVIKIIMCKVGDVVQGGVGLIRIFPDTKAQSSSTINEEKSKNLNDNNNDITKKFIDKQLEDIERRKMMVGCKCKFFIVCESLLNS
jgi:pyruvate/2-oxoglutarate dehydrogenase complex dihydrolipoamide acyltransferase (E2) component